MNIDFTKIDNAKEMLDKLNQTEIDILMGVIKVETLKVIIHGGKQS